MMKSAFGKVMITPPDGVIGKTLAGYTPVPRATGKLDDIYAHVAIIEDLFLETIKRRLILISLDFLKVPLLFTDYVKEKIQENFYIHPDQILIHATHTHKSLDMGGEFVWPGGMPSVLRSIMFGAYHSDDKYKVWIAKKIVALVGHLLENLRDAKFAWKKETIQDDVLINRRHPIRYSKSDLWVLSFKDVNTGEIFGLIVSYGMHPTTQANIRTQLTADYPGRLVHKIEELSGGRIAPVFFNGPCGDLNPVTTAGTDFELFEKNKNERKKRVYGQRGDYTHTTKIGYFLGEKAFSLAKSIPDEDYLDTFEYKSYTKVFWVPMVDYKEVLPANWPWSHIMHLIKRWVLLRVALWLGDSEEPNFPGFAIKHRGKDIMIYSQVHLINIRGTNSVSGERKDLTIVGIPGELFEDYGKEIIKHSPSKENTIVFENANDWIGYLFPLKEYVLGGYEPTPSFGVKAGPLTMEAYHELLEDIENDITTGFS